MKQGESGVNETNSPMKKKERKKKREKKTGIREKKNPIGI